MYSPTTVKYCFQNIPPPPYFYETKTSEPQGDITTINLVKSNNYLHLIYPDWSCNT